jgi:hypothetical protein
MTAVRLVYALASLFAVGQAVPKMKDDPDIPPDLQSNKKEEIANEVTQGAF